MRTQTSAIMPSRSTLMAVRRGQHDMNGNLPRTCALTARRVGLMVLYVSKDGNMYLCKEHSLYHDLQS